MGIFGLFHGKDRWRWDSHLDAVPNRKVLKAQYEALAAVQSPERRVEVLQHIAEIAEENEDVQVAMLEANITQEVCRCFIDAPIKVQQAAALALTELCSGHTGSAEAAAAVIPHVFTTVENFMTNLELAKATTQLMKILLTNSSQAVTALLQPGGMSTLLQSIQQCSAELRKPDISSDRHQDLQSFLCQMVSLLWSITSYSPDICKELGKSQGLKTLLDLTQNHEDHEVLETSLGALGAVLTTVPQNKLQLVDAEGVRKLLNILKNLQLPWEVRHHSCYALQQLCRNRTACSDFINLKGLDAVTHLLEIWSSRISDPDRMTVLEELLEVVDAVAGDPTQSTKLIEQGRLQLLVRTFLLGMQDFRGGSYRIAVLSAQALYHLAGHAAILPVICQAEVTNPLAMLVERGPDYAACESAKHAAIIHGAWCAAGVLCKVWLGPQQQLRNSSSVAKSRALRSCVELLDATGPLLVASLVAGQDAGEFSCTGRIYLKVERVAASIQAAATDLLRVLQQVAEDVALHADLRQMGLTRAVARVLTWPQLQLSAKRCLHQLGEMEVEYQPLVRYSQDLLALLLERQGVDPQPFLAHDVDAHLMLGLTDEYMQETLRLDQVQVMKVARIQRAHQLFHAMDFMDGKVNGMVARGDVEAYLVQHGNLRKDHARDLAKRLFDGLQVLEGEPLCFLQFVSEYPWLSLELEAYQPPSPGGASAPRSSKRPRLSPFPQDRTTDVIDMQ